MTQKETANKNTSESRPLWGGISVVGIGASAGGLEALQQFFQHAGLIVEGKSQVPDQPFPPAFHQKVPYAVPLKICRPLAAHIVH